MIGTSISNIVLAFQHEARNVLKDAKDDLSKVVGHLLSDLQARGILSADDLKSLQDSFAEASSVLADKIPPSRGLILSRERYAALVANHNSNDVARALAELCVSVMSAAAAVPSVTTQPGVITPQPGVISSAATSSGNITGGEKVLVCALIGAGIGGELAGLPGALVGAAVGAAVGGCDDNYLDNTVPIL